MTWAASVMSCAGSAATSSLQGRLVQIGFSLVGVLIAALIALILSLAS